VLVKAVSFWQGRVFAKGHLLLSHVIAVGYLVLVAVLTNELAGLLLTWFSVGEQSIK
jgi:hypothetical protein